MRIALTVLAVAFAIDLFLGALIMLVALWSRIEMRRLHKMFATWEYEMLTARDEEVEDAG